MLIKNAKKYGFAAKRIFLAGDSAGGTSLVRCALRIGVKSLLELVNQSRRHPAKPNSRRVRLSVARSTRRHDFDEHSFRVRAPTQGEKHASQAA